jgi:phage baseplate assembly protein W
MATSFMDKVEDKAFLGVGWSYPVALNQTGEVALSLYEEDIREAIRIILGTNPGERVMRPDFGAGLQALTFEPINATTIALTKHRVEEALIVWEPRIDNITVEVSPELPVGRLLVDIRYRVRATNSFYNLVYPFYLMEGRQP